MFTLRSQPNALANFAGAAAQRFSEHEAENYGLRQKSERVMNALQGLDENSSPLDWFRAISSAPEDIQSSLWKGYEQVQNKEKSLKKSEQDRTQFESDFRYAKDQGMDDAFADAYARGTQKEKGLIRQQWLKDKERVIEEEEPIELSGTEVEEPSENPQGNESQKPTKKSSIKLTPSEKIKRDNDRFRLQTPIYAKIKEELSGAEKEANNLQIMDDINESDELPEGLERLNIDWSTGDIRVPALANAATQRFAKTVADFLSGAKAIFGARVTNYDLDAFKKRLPNLANSKEGRQLIVKQMQILNEASQAENKALKQAFDANGGVRGIDYDKAVSLADKKMKGQRKQFQKRLRDLDGRVAMLDKENIERAKKNLKPGYILMLKPDGTYTQINEKQASAAERQSGYRKL